MFTTQTFNTISTGLLLILASAVPLIMTSCSSKYEVKATSESISVNHEDLEVVEILKEGKPIPLTEWKEALNSGDYFVTQVASEELRKRYSEGR